VKELYLFYASMYLAALKHQLQIPELSIF